MIIIDIEKFRESHPANVAREPDLNQGKLIPFSFRERLELNNEVAAGDYIVDIEGFLSLGENRKQYTYFDEASLNY